MNTEILRIKKQLLDAKNTIAELTDENKNLQDTIVQLQTQFYEIKEKNRELENLNQSFEKQLALERRKAVLEDGAKLEEMIVKLKETEDTLVNRNLNVKYLEGLVELKDGQLKEVEAKMQDLLAKVSGSEEVNIIEMFKKESKEKKILHEKIMELTEELNNVRNVCNAIAAENCQLKEVYNVPPNFGLNLRDFDLATAIFKENFKSKILQLEREIEGLEAERATLKNNLRQMSMMVNINSKTNPLFHGLPDEKILMIEQYALNIRDDKVELPLNDRSKELQKQIQYLEAHIAFLKEREKTSMEEVLDLLRNIQAQGVNPVIYASNPIASKLLDSNSPFKDSFDRKMIKSLRYNHEFVKRSARGKMDQGRGESQGNLSHVALTVKSVNKRDIIRSESIYAKGLEEKENDYNDVLKDVIELDDIDTVKHVLMKTYAELEKVCKEKDYFETKYKEVLGNNEKEVEDETKVKTQLNKKEMEFLRHKDELNISMESLKRKIHLLETKCKSYEKLINDHLNEDTNVELIQENAITQEENINIRRENSLLLKKLEYIEKGLLIEKDSFFDEKKHYTKRVAHMETLLLENRGLVEELSLKSLNQVDIVEHRELLFKYKLLEDKYAKMKVNHLNSSELIESNVTAQRQIIQLNNQLNQLYELNSNLAVQYKILDHLCKNIDEEYHYFSNLCGSILDKIKAAGANDIENELSTIASENNNRLLVDQRFASIFSYFGVKLSNYDMNIIRRYMCVAPADKIDLNSFLRHLRIHHSFVDKKSEAVSIRFRSLLSAFNSVESSPTALFRYFDVNSTYKVFMGDMIKGFEKMNLKVDRFDVKLLYNVYAMSEDDYFNQEELVLVHKHLTQNAAVESFLDKSKLSVELALAQDISTFIETNKLGIKSHLDLLGLFDSREKGYLNVNDLRGLLNEKMGKNLAIGAIENLALFICKRDDYKIYLSDFEAFLNQAKQFSQTNLLLSKPIAVVNKVADNNFNTEMSKTVETYKLNAINQSYNNFKNSVERLTLQVKQQRETIEFLESSLARSEEAYKRLNKEHKQLRDRYLTDKQERDNKMVEIANSVEETSGNDALMQQDLIEEKEMNKILIDENDSLKIQLAKFEDELFHTRQLSLKNAGEDSSRAAEIKLMMQFLNGKYEEGSYKKTIEKYKQENERLQMKIEALEYKIENQNQRRYELGIFFINQINTLQEEIAKVNVQELSTFDVSELDKLSNNLEDLNRRFKQEKLENQQIREMLKDLEIKCTNLELEQEQAMKLAEAIKNPNPNMLHKQLETLMKESKELKIKNITLDKRMMFISHNEANLNSDIKLQEEVSDKLESELKQQIIKYNDREMYWTTKITNILKNNSKLNDTKIEEKSSRTKNPVEMSTDSAKRYDSSSKVHRDHLPVAKLAQELQLLKQENEDLAFKLKALENKEALEDIEKKFQEKRVFSQVERQQSNLLGAAQNSIKLLQTVINEKDLELDELKEDINGLKSKISSLKSEISVKNAEIENLKLFAKNTPSVSKDTIKDRYDALKQFEEKKHDDYQIVLENYKARITILEEENNQLDALTKELLEKLRVAQGKNEELLIQNKDHELISTLKTQVLNMNQALKEKDAKIDGFMCEVNDLNMTRNFEHKKLEDEKFLEEQKLKDDIRYKTEVEMRIKLANQKLQTYKLKHTNAVKETENLKVQLKFNEDQLQSTTKQLGHYKELLAKSVKLKTDENNLKKPTALNHFSKIVKKETIN